MQSSASLPLFPGPQYCSTSLPDLVLFGPCQGFFTQPLSSPNTHKVCVPTFLFQHRVSYMTVNPLSPILCSIYLRLACPMRSPFPLNTLSSLWFRNCLNLDFIEKKIDDVCENKNNTKYDVINFENALYMTYKVFKPKRQNMKFFNHSSNVQNISGTKWIREMQTIFPRWIRPSEKFCSPHCSTIFRRRDKYT